MAGNAFIKFSDVKEGESYTKSHPGSDGWLEIGDWSWEASAETSFMKGGGSAVGKPHPGSLSFTHFFDLSSTVIMQKIVSGKHFETVTLDMLKQAGGVAPQTYLRIVMKWAFITKVATKGGEDGSVNQDVEMVFKEIYIGYKQQLNDGALDKSAIPFEWSVPTMTLVTTITDKTLPT